MDICGITELTKIRKGNNQEMLLRQNRFYLIYLQSGDTVPMKYWQIYWYSFQASLPSISSDADLIGVMGGWSPTSVPDRGF